MKRLGAMFPCQGGGGLHDPRIIICTYEILSSGIKTYHKSTSETLWNKMTNVYSGFFSFQKIKKQGPVKRK